MSSAVALARHALGVAVPLSAHSAPNASTKPKLLLAVASSEPGTARRASGPVGLKRVDCSYERAARSGGNACAGTTGAVPCSG
jgi:hypothetical protein